MLLFTRSIVALSMAMALSTVTIPAVAQTTKPNAGPLRLDGLARKGDLTTFADSNGTKKAQTLHEADLKFPIDALEKTPTGMARIQVNGKDFWVQIEDFRSHREVSASCTHGNSKERAGAERGANETCPRG